MTSESWYILETCQLIYMPRIMIEMIMDLGDMNIMAIGRIRTRRVDALSIKRGPTQSGAVPQVTTRAGSVGGVILATDVLWAAIVLLLVIPLATILYGRRKAVLRLLAPALSRFVR